MFSDAIMNKLCVHKNINNNITNTDVFKRKHYNVTLHKMLLPLDLEQLILEFVFGTRKFRLTCKHLPLLTYTDYYLFPTQINNGQTVS